MTGTPIVGAQGYEIIWSGFDDPSDEDDDFFPDLGGGNYNEWPSVEVNFGDPETRYVQSVHGKVMGWSMEGRPGESEEKVYFDVNYELQSMTMVSCNTGNDPDGSCVDTPWEYGETPERYGAIYINEPNTPQNKNAGQLSTCSTEGGVVNGNQSGYVYTDVFYKTSMSYRPLNSVKSNGRFGGVLSISGRDPIRREPIFPDVEDPNGKSAPIYPMDAITAFLPDDRDEVWIKYTVTMRARVSGQGNLTDTITIAHKVTQNSANYADKLRELQRLCNFSNPGDIAQEDFSPYYPLNYPYTIVKDSAPTSRETYEEEDGPLQKGDVWYSPGGSRKYYNINDIPRKLEIKDKGRNYKTADNVETIYTPPKENECEESDPMTKPYGLRVNIVANDKGEVTSAEISDTEENVATKFEDGDVVNITGGNGTAQLTIKISDNFDNWSSNFIREN